MTENKTILRLKDNVSADLYTLLTTGRILFLTLNRKWYVKIACGEKKEEYRDVKPYWIRRFINWMSEPNWGMNDFVREFEYHGNELGFVEKHGKEFDLIVFVNGYGNAPTTIVEHKGLEIKMGREEWGAVAKQFYLTLKLGKVLYTEPCS
jgi:hypothetical protein